MRRVLVIVQNQGRPREKWTRNHSKSLYLCDDGLCIDLDKPGCTVERVDRESATHWIIFPPERLNASEGPALRKSYAKLNPSVEEKLFEEAAYQQLLHSALEILKNQEIIHNFF